MKGYEFVVFNKSQTLRILFASDGFADQESMLSLFSPAQASRVHNIMKAGGGVCPCADETRCAVIFTDSVDYVAFAVILDRPCDGTLPTSAADIDDAVIKRLVNVFQRATHIGIVYERFPSEALIEANMLLCEFIRTRVVESNRIAASYGFAVVNARRLVTRLISLIVFIIQNISTGFTDLSFQACLFQSLAYVRLKCSAAPPSKRLKRANASTRLCI